MGLGVVGVRVVPSVGLVAVGVVRGVVVFA